MWGDLAACVERCHPRHQAIFHPLVGLVSGQFILCNLLQVEQGKRGQGVAAVAAEGSA